MGKWIFKNSHGMISHTLWKDIIESLGGNKEYQDVIMISCGGERVGVYILFFFFGVYILLCTLVSFPSSQ